MSQTSPNILAINGGSSSVRFALYRVDEALERGLHGKIDRIGLTGTSLTFDDPTRKLPRGSGVAVPSGVSVAEFLIDWLEKQNGLESIRAVGHRVVHGMKHTDPEPVTNQET